MKRQPKKKRGSTHLLNQYSDFCSKCRHKLSTITPKDQLWCAEFDEFMNIDKLTEAPVFCMKGKFLGRHKK